MLSILKQIFNLADINIDIPFPKNIKKEIKTINHKDLQCLENYLKNHICLTNLGIYLTLYTGIRIGELCALKWEDFDFVNNKIIINKSLKRVFLDNHISKTVVIVDSPKSFSSIREIPLPSTISNYLKSYNFSSNSFFLTGSSKFVDPRLLSMKFKKILKSLNFSDYTFHTLRHTFATNCIEIGCDAKTLSLILGHSSFTITLDKYVHPDFSQKAKLIHDFELKSANSGI